jgi:hypothetical protein
VPDALDEFIAASPWFQRPTLRMLAALGRRPRGMALLKLIAPADQVATGLHSMAFFDDPARAKQLGWDAEAVIARGRELRRREGRP